MPDDTDIVDEPLDVVAPAPVVAAPPVAAPAEPGPMVLPPEFLAEAARRYAAARSGPMVAPPGYYSGGSFNPETGRVTSFQGMAPPAAPPDPMEQIRKSINAMQFKQAQDAYKAATIFQATRAYQNDIKAAIARGESPEKAQHDAIGKWGRLMFIDNPGALPGMTRETRTIPDPSVAVYGGVPFVRHGRYGTDVTPLPVAPPDTVKTYPVEGSPEQYGTVNPKTGAIAIHTKPKPPATPAGTQLRAIDEEMKEVQVELGRLRDYDNPKMSALRDLPVYQKYKDIDRPAEIKNLEGRLNTLRERRRSFFEQGTPAPSAAPAPAVKPATTARSQADIDEIIRQANEAIKKANGRNRAGVLKRLKEMGIDVKE